MSACQDPAFGRRGCYLSTDLEAGPGLGSNYVSKLPLQKSSELHQRHRIEPRSRISQGRERREVRTQTPNPQTMFKPRLRIPRRPVLGTTPSCAAAPRSLSSPFAAAAKHQQQQQQQLRAIHASPARLRHSVAPLTEDGRFEKHGVPGLLSPEAFDASYTNYQGWVLDKLNSLTEGT